MARPGVVMFWCWLASVGAGVVRREDVILSARRMRASLDMEYELMYIEQLLDDPDKVGLPSLEASMPSGVGACTPGDTSMPTLISTVPLWSTLLCLP